MKNIILIGMPACGKSVTGVILAKSLKMNFIDADLLIQERAGKSVKEIKSYKGIETFKSIEEEVLNAINVKNTVIATGGSAVYYDSAMRHLKENGVVVYIEASLATIKKRLKNIRTRGVAMEKGQTIDSLYEMRVPLYEKYADCTVRSHRYRAENTVEDIISGLEKIKI